MHPFAVRPLLHQFTGVRVAAKRNLFPWFAATSAQRAGFGLRGNLGWNLLN